MLVTFKSEAHGDIPMFGDVAVKLLKLMGQSGNVPGALMAEDVLAARNALRQALGELPDEVAHGVLPEDQDDPDAPPPPIGLATRAQPLLELLDAAIADQASVIWQE